MILTELTVGALLVTTIPLEIAALPGVVPLAAAGVTSKVEKHFDIKFADLNGVDPQIVTAFGAALLAEENAP